MVKAKRQTGDVLDQFRSGAEKEDMKKSSNNQVIQNRKNIIL